MQYRESSDVFADVPSTLSRKPSIMHATTLSQTDITKAKATKFVTDVYVRMILALVASAVVGYVSLNSGLLLSGLNTMGRGLTLGIFGTQLLTVIAFQGSVFRMKPALARVLFAVYAVITGLTLGLIGLLYTLDSILMVALLSGGAFAGLAFYGKTTKRDLGPIGTFALCSCSTVLAFSSRPLFQLCSPLWMPPSVCTPLSVRFFSQLSSPMNRRNSAMSPGSSL
jgi:FtsH-binding integral membrane protein